MCKLFGITGGIGSGKSVVSSVLKLMGFAVYDCDSRAKWLMNTSQDIKNGLTAIFGDEVYVGGMLNRQLLGSKIFNNKELLDKVNSIVHPVVKQDLTEWRDSQNNGICFVESAILYESGLDSMVTGVINVSAPVELRIRRVMARSGLSAQQVRARISNQNKVSHDMAKEYEVINDEMTPILPQIVRFLEKEKAL